MSLTVAGVLYVPVDAHDYTVDYDLYMQDVLTVSALTDLEKEITGIELLTRLAAAKMTAALVAGVVKTPGRWTRVNAEVAAVNFNKAVPAERDALIKSLVDGIEAFFNNRAAIIADFPILVQKRSKKKKETGAGPELRGARQLGQWDSLVRVLSEYNPEYLDRYLQWHLRDALLAYEDRLRQRALEDYRTELLCYACVAPHAKKGTLKPPKPPRILQG